MSPQYAGSRVISSNPRIRVGCDCIRTFFLNFYNFFNPRISYEMRLFEDI